MILVGLFAGRAFAAEPVSLNWLGAEPPGVEQGVNWGVPWPKGELRPDAPLALRDGRGAAIPMQTWPLAYWPDGSVKWSGHAIAAAPGAAGPLQLGPGAATAPSTALRASTQDGWIDVDTGTMRARIPRRGANLIESLAMGNRTVAQNGRLLLLLEDRSEPRVVREEDFVSRVESAVLEQSGPVRAVVKIDGRHQSLTSERAWLPFTVRLYFYAGSESVRITHSFVFDGDGNRDFIKGLGMAFSVPFQEERHNRHIRFAGDGDGVWVQPVVMAPGFRPAAGSAVIEPYADHLEGKRMPNLAELPEQARNAILTMPVWGDALLSQPGPNTFSIRKRTADDRSWVQVTDGHRSLGLAVLGDVSGGIAVGLRDFWQKHPSAIEIKNGGTDMGEMRVWFWSPEGEPMDLRHYSDRPHGLSINYEDWKPGWATPEGIANTHEITLWAFDAVPASAELAAMARAVSEPPILVATPEYYHQLQVFGRWSLPDRSTPTLRWIEDQIEGFVDYYRDQVEERSWYGFWNYGDLMHNYDFVRHEWRYDIGGWAWINTELMPDILLWHTFLRTGRADIYRMAEAMTRHTSEVDVHHVGPFAPLGSRHNVSHWGDGAKQPRVSHAGIKNFYYYLAADDRIGDLMRNQLDADRTYAVLQQYNGAHYVPTPDGGYIPDRPRNQRALEAPTPDELRQMPRPERTLTQRMHGDWAYYAINWMTEWERTGDPKWRDHIMTEMRAMVENAQDGRLSGGGTFGMLFGGPESMYQLQQMIDYPEFWAAWANTLEASGRQASGNAMTGPRLLAYAAEQKGSAELGMLAWEKLVGNALANGVPEVVSFRRVESPGLIKPLHDPVFLGESVGWQLHGPASIQWALNAIQTMAMAREFLPMWEAAPRPAAAR